MDGVNPETVENQRSRTGAATSLMVKTWNMVPLVWGTVICSSGQERSTMPSALSAAAVWTWFSTTWASRNNV